MIPRRRIGGAAPPNDKEEEPDDRVVRGQQAWKQLKEAGRTSWTDWKLVGVALLAGRQHAMKTAKTSQPVGKRYNELFHVWLETSGFSEIDKSDRAKLLLIMRDVDPIEKWLAGKTDAERASWNHPSTVWRVSRCKDRGIAAVNKPEAPVPNPKDLPPPPKEFEDDDAEFIWQRGLLLRARKAIGDAKLNDLWPVDEPPDAGLIDIVRQAADAWIATADYLESISARSEELAEARKSGAEGRYRRAQVKERKESRLREKADALEGAR